MFKRAPLIPLFTVTDRQEPKMLMINSIQYIW